MRLFIVCMYYNDFAQPEICLKKVAFYCFAFNHYYYVFLRK